MTDLRPIGFYLLAQGSLQHRSPGEAHFQSPDRPSTFPFLTMRQAQPAITHGLLSQIQAHAKDRWPFLFFSRSLSTWLPTFLHNPCLPRFLPHAGLGAFVLTFASCSKTSCPRCMVASTRARAHTTLARAHHLQLHRTNLCLLPRVVYSLRRLLPRVTGLADRLVSCTTNCSSSALLHEPQP